MRYLITGGAGFIGSHLADALVARRHSVVALDDLSTGRIENLAHGPRNSALRFVRGSVLDEPVVDELVKECDVVIHLAAAVGVKLVVEQPLRSLVTNVRGCEIVLGVADRHRKKTLIASSSEIYGKNPAGPLSETSDRILGAPASIRWAYSASKAVGETLAFAHYTERGLPTVVVRLFNTVGPRQSPAYGMVIPRFVQQAVAGEPLTVFGDGHQTRCFCHVRDVVDALLRLLDHPSAEGEVFNVGSTEEVSILELAQRIKARTGSTSEIQLIPHDRIYEGRFEDMVRGAPDIDKIGALTGWAPTENLDAILEEAIADARMNWA
jgi:UDP-glucose 4-epimerase